MPPPSAMPARKLATITPNAWMLLPRTWLSIRVHNTSWKNATAPASSISGRIQAGAATRRTSALATTRVVVAVARLEYRDARLPRDHARRSKNTSTLIAAAAHTVFRQTRARAAARTRWTARRRPRRRCSSRRAARCAGRCALAPHRVTREQRQRGAHQHGRQCERDEGAQTDRRARWRRACCPAERPARRTSRAAAQSLTSSRAGTSTTALAPMPSSSSA